VEEPLLEIFFCHWGIFYGNKWSDRRGGTQGTNENVSFPHIYLQTGKMIFKKNKKIQIYNHF
jgi:hypothetical protein